MKIELSKKQLEYLKSNLVLNRQDLAKYFNKNINFDRYVVEISDDVIDEIRDWAGERLQEVGFDINYASTDEGEILEELIDLFHN